MRGSHSRHRLPGLLQDTTQCTRLLFKSKRTFKNQTNEKNKRGAIWLLDAVPSKYCQFKNIALIQGNQWMTLLEKNWAYYKVQGLFPMENAIIYFFSTSSPVKNALELNAWLWPAVHTLPNRIHMSKEEACCWEEKIHNFLPFPFLSRTTLLWGTNQGLVTIHHTIFSILTASKNQEPGRVDEDGPIIPRKARAFVVGPSLGLLIQPDYQVPGIQISLK